MPIEPGLETNSPVTALHPAGDVAAPDPRAPAPASNLAKLLDSFTEAFIHPEGETVGSFAATVQALHGELAMIARHIRSEATAGGASEQIDFDEIFPEDTAVAHEPAGTGVAADEELEHTCRELSRD